MTKRALLSLAVLALACPFLHAQSSALSGASQDSSGCSEASLALGVDCGTAQQTTTTVLPVPDQSAGNSSVSPATLGETPGLSATSALGGVTANPENAPLTNAQSPALQAPLPPDPPTEFQKFVAATTGQYLPIYGAELFRRVPTTFSPNNQAPVPAQYVIGPDDELRIRIWGQINFSNNLRVDRSGNIYLPQVGPVHVAGIPFADLDQHLRAAVARLYRNFDLSVDVGRIRSIQVYVTGQARRPGAYTISSLSSLVNAIFATGGPAPQGSMRHILLKREGKTVADFDLYALLIQGDKSQDIPLLPEDVIFIPPAGPQVAITGSVRTPAIYELKNGDTIGSLLDMAGTTAMSSTARLSLDRIDASHARHAMEFDLAAAGRATPLADGDILHIYSVTPAYDKTVTLRGNVANPGRFGWHEGMRLSDLIPDQDSLLTRDYWWKRSHLGLPTPEFEPAISTIGENQQPVEYTNRGLTTSVTQDTLTRVLSQGNPSQDAGAMLSAGNTNNAASTASSMDAANRQRASNANLAEQARQVPGVNAPAQRNLVSQPPTQINWNYAVIERTDPQTLQTHLIPFELGRLVINHDASQNLELQPGDAITIFSQADIRVPLNQQVKYVELEGEFVRSGYYSVQPGETLRDLVRRAGGLTPNAYLYGSEFTRESTRVLQQERLDEFVRQTTQESERGTQALVASGAGSDVAAAQAANQQMIGRLSQVRATGRIVLTFQPDTMDINQVPNISLENGDKFVVPFRPASVNVVGSVYDQNSYLFERGHELSHYLKLAGGADRNADWRHAFLIRADGSVVSRKHAQGDGFWKKSFMGLTIYPGDTIVVPSKTIRPTALKNFIDWSQIFSQLALGAAAINVL